MTIVALVGWTLTLDRSPPYSSRVKRVSLRHGAVFRPITAWLCLLALTSVVLAAAVPSEFAWAQKQCQARCNPDNPDDTQCGCPGWTCTRKGPKGGACVAPPPPALPAPATKLNPALVSIGKIFYEFAVSSDNMHVLYTFWKLGGGSEGWYDLGGLSVPLATDPKPVSGPAAAAYGTEDNYYIFVTVTGNDGKIYLNQGFHANWVGWQ